MEEALTALPYPGQTLITMTRNLLRPSAKVVENLSIQAKAVGDFFAESLFPGREK